MTSSVEPPPRSTSRIGWREIRHRVDGAGVGQRSLLGAADHLGIDAERRRAPSPRSRRGCAASRVALVAIMRDALDVEPRDRGGVVGERDAGAVERLGRERAGAVDALPEPDDAHLAVQRRDRRRRATSRRIELVPQSMARYAHGPSAPPLGRAGASASSPSGFTPGPAANG